LAQPKYPIYIHKALQDDHCGIFGQGRLKRGISAVWRHYRFVIPFCLSSVRNSALAGDFGVADGGDLCGQVSSRGQTDPGPMYDIIKKLTGLRKGAQNPLSCRVGALQL
jgi:hypothetical protein